MDRFRYNSAFQLNQQHTLMQQRSAIAPIDSQIEIHCIPTHRPTKSPPKMQQNKKMFE
jgi:hypothetical protein